MVPRSLRELLKAYRGSSGGICPGSLGREEAETSLQVSKTSSPIDFRGSQGSRGQCGARGEPPGRLESFSLAVVWNQLILVKQKSRGYPENVILLGWWEKVTLSHLLSSIFLRQWMGSGPLHRR